MSNGLHKLLLATIILVVTFTTPMIAQLDDPLAPTSSATPFYFGPVIGYNRVLHSADIATFESEVPCPVFQNGSANGYFFGISFEYLLGSAKNSTSSIIARLLYNSMPASFEAEGDEYPSLLYNETTQESTPIQSSTRNFNEVVYDMITFEAQYKLNLFDTEFGLIVGPTFDFALTKDQTQTLELLTPEGARFARATDSPEELEAAGISRVSDDGRTLFFEEGEIPNSNALRIGIKFGVQYEIILNNGFYIVPNFNYNFGVTNLSDDDDWRVSALQLGVDIRFPSTSIF